MGFVDNLVLMEVVLHWMIASPKYKIGEYGFQIRGSLLADNDAGCRVLNGLGLGEGEEGRHRGLEQQ